MGGILIILLVGLYESCDKRKSTNYANKKKILNNLESERPLKNRIKKLMKWKKVDNPKPLLKDNICSVCLD